MIEKRRADLITKCQEKFDAMENSNDLAILYEITGFQGDYASDKADFWSNYSHQKKVLAANQIAINKDTSSSSSSSSSEND